MIIRSEIVSFDEPLPLECGRELKPFDIAYAQYGQLNAARDNAVLVLHGLTSDQHAAGPSGPSGRPGWWDAVIGPGKTIDTERWCVISPNALGSYGGSSGPSSPDPKTGRPYALRFPIVTIGDIVASQARLADHLGIARFHAVMGGCFGGFQTLEWMARYSDRVGRAIVITATPRTSAHNLALWAVARKAIQSDPNWKRGDYYDGPSPDTGLALTAMFGALFWMSRETYEQKFGLKRITGDAPAYGFEPEFEVENFLESVGRNAAGRIDANALLYLTRAVDYFDMTRGRASLSEVFADYRSPTLLVSYATDWRYPTEEMAEIAAALDGLGAPSRHVTLESPGGHGSFLYDTAGLAPLLGDFLESVVELKRAGNDQAT